MNKKQILNAFRKLNDALEAQGIKGEIGIVGGAAMVLAYKSRAATRDVDGIFEPAGKVRAAARTVAHSLKLPEDWLNDSVKGFLPGDPPSRQAIVKHGHLLVWAPPADYLLAMKAVSARFDSKDAQDVRTLCEFLKLKHPRQVLEIIARYYPAQQVPPKTVFFVEELFEKGP